MWHTILKKWGRTFEKRGYCKNGDDDDYQDDNDNEDDDDDNDGAHAKHDTSRTKGKQISIPGKRDALISLRC